MRREGKREGKREKKGKKRGGYNVEEKGSAGNAEREEMEGRG